MKKIFLNLCAGTVMTCCAASAFAGGTTGLGGISETLIYSGHTGLLVRHTNMVDPDRCGRTDWLILPDSHPHYKVALAAILGAHFSKQKVFFILSGCLQGLPSIQHIGTSQE